MTLNKNDIHPLLQEPKEVGLNFRAQLEQAYVEKITNLSEHFTGVSGVQRPTLPVTVYYYSDNAGNLNDTAPKEIKRFLNDSANIVSVLSGIEKPEIEYADTLAQSWVTGGFDLAQTTRYGMVGVGNVTFLNCAPRLDERGKDDNRSNKGEPIYVGVLPNGHVISANSRYNFVHFRDAVENGALEIFEVNVQQDGTQFRSRDIFPTHAVVLANQLTQNVHLWKPNMDLEQRRALLEAVGYVDLDAKLALEDIPKLEQFSVSHIDVHGNVKTNTRYSELDEDNKALFDAGETFTIRLNGSFYDGRFTQRMFDRKEGEPGISRGSSGHNWQGAANDDGFLEISIIGESAAKVFDLKPEDLKTVKAIEIIRDGAGAHRYPVLNGQMVHKPEEGPNSSIH